MTDHDHDEKLYIRRDGTPGRPRRIHGPVEDRQALADAHGSDIIDADGMVVARPRKRAGRPGYDLEVLAIYFSQHAAEWNELKGMRARLAKQTGIVEQLDHLNTETIETAVNVVVDRAFSFFQKITKTAGS
jgi:hypothetical protein